MRREIILTKDGSHTIAVPELNVTYHSIYGAIQESLHVFIEAGLNTSGRFRRPGMLKILEAGFGTGLNALLTFIETEKTGTKIYYETIEPYPLEEAEGKSLNYCRQLSRQDLLPFFEKLHTCGWEQEMAVTENFIFKKTRTSLINYSANQLYHLIYYDAFAPNAQPELWTKEVFDKMYSWLVPGGILVTYCCKGDVRRAMTAAGFSVEKIPGPPGKREMLRATKPD